MPNLIFYHEDTVASQASNSPRRDSSYTHLRFPGASTKRTIHDVLPSRVYMYIIRSNTLAGEHGQAVRECGQAVQDYNEKYRLDGPN